MSRRRWILGSKAAIALIGLAGLAACGNDAASPPQPPPATAGCQPVFLELTGRVVDEADLLPTKEEATLVAALAALETRTKHQMVVATVKSLDRMPIERYSLCLANRWGIGRKGVNDGVLFTVAPNERRTRIEVGDGLAGKLTDREAAAILARDVLPAFGNSEFAAGIAAGSAAIIREIE